MKTALFLAALLCGAAATTSAWADGTTTKIYSDQAWAVEITDFGDGTKVCDAYVYSADAAGQFTVWETKDSKITLQFFSEHWHSGVKGSVVNIDIQIDGYKPWVLSGLDGSPQSVQADLPADEAANKFFPQLSSGKELHLYDARTKTKEADYSLAGAGPAVAKLRDCVGLLN